MGSAHPHSAQNRRSELFSVLQLAQRILEPSQGDSHPQANQLASFAKGKTSVPAGESRSSVAADRLPAVLHF